MSLAEENYRSYGTYMTYMRPKPFLTYFLLCAIPFLLLAELNYWNGTRSVDSTVSTIAQNDLNAFSGAVDELLEENRKSMLQLAIAPVWFVAVPATLLRAT